MKKIWIFILAIMMVAISFSFGEETQEEDAGVPLVSELTPATDEELQGPEANPDEEHETDSGIEELGVAGTEPEAEESSLPDAGDNSLVEDEEFSEVSVNENNYGGTPRPLTVWIENTDPEPEPRHAPDSQPDSDPSEPAGFAFGWSEEEEAVQKAEMIYHLTVVLATDREYALLFDAPVSSPESFQSLTSRDTGIIVDPSNYHIYRDAKSDGYSISFEKGFIQTLRPGRNDFILSWNEGSVRLRVTII